MIEEIVDYNKNAQRFFLVASEAHKGKSEPKSEESNAERTKLRREEKNINNKLFDYYFGYLNPSNICNRLINVTGETKKNRIDTINKQLKMIN